MVHDHSKLPYIHAPPGQQPVGMGGCAVGCADFRAEEAFVLLRTLVQVDAFEAPPHLHHVLGLDVAVDCALLVEELEDLGHVCERRQHARVVARQLLVPQKLSQVGRPSLHDQAEARR
eukprot:405478-Rhodomonas_salina.2